MSRIFFFLMFFAFTHSSIAQSSDNPYDFRDTESNDGLIRVRYNNKYGFINEKGKITIPLEFEKAENFDQGLAKVSKDGETYGFIDTKGRVVIPLKYEYVREKFVNGYMPAVYNRKYGMINNKGKTIVPHQYDKLEDFSNGLAIAGVEIGGEVKFGYVNEKGDQIIPLMYQSLGNFQEGLALAVKDEKFGFINIKNETVIPFQYETASSFSEGLAAVETGTGWGFIDQKNRMVLSPVYTYAGSFKNGEAKVYDQVDKYFIDKKGRRLKDGRWLLIYTKGLKMGEQYWDLSTKNEHVKLNEKYNAGFKFTIRSFDDHNYKEFTLMSKNHVYTQYAEGNLTREKMKDLVSEHVTKRSSYVDYISYSKLKKKWHVGVSRYPAYKQQLYIEHASFPHDLVNDNFKKGFFISTIAFGDGHWIIIMRKESYQHQLVKSYDADALDLNEINNILSQGYAITALAKNDFTHNIVFTKGTGIKEQLLRWEEEIPALDIKNYWEKGYDLYKVYYLQR